MKKTLRAFVIALVVATTFAVATPKVQTYSVQWYTGYFYPNWWNPFVWCTWQMWVDDGGNYDYWDSCGGSDSYLSLSY